MRMFYKRHSQSLLSPLSLKGLEVKNVVLLLDLTWKSGIRSAAATPQHSVAVVFLCWILYKQVHECVCLRKYICLQRECLDVYFYCAGAAWIPVLSACLQLQIFLFPFFCVKRCLVCVRVFVFLVLGVCCRESTFNISCISSHSRFIQFSFLFSTCRVHCCWRI